MFCVMKVFWFLGFAALYFPIVVHQKKEELDASYIVWFDVLTAAFAVLYNVSHWIYAMSYLQLAYRITE